MAKPMKTLHLHYPMIQFLINNNYFMSPRWIWSDKITNERVARVGYNHIISNKGEWNNCFSKFSKPDFAADFYLHNFTKRKFLNLTHYFRYDVKLRPLAHSRSFLANQTARNAIVRAENLLNIYNYVMTTQLCGTKCMNVWINHMTF